MPENATTAQPTGAVVAGHICLDMIPGLDHLAAGAFQTLFQPGHLVNTGPALFSTGGPVSNTGLALHRLGIPTSLIAKVGDDPFGQIVRGLVAKFDPNLADGLVTDPGATTSYSVIISPPGEDRIFLHCPGANDTFDSADIDLELVRQARLFHFGYPPIMKRMYQDGGEALVEVFRLARFTGVTTSLDLSYPDPTSESGRADWHAILRAALPYVDIFLPSFEEILFMLHRARFEQMMPEAPGGKLINLATPGMLSELACELMELGAKVVVIKLGERGLYVRTAGTPAILEMGRACPTDPAAWSSQELWAPCFKVNMVGTTGSGDATIAGFLSALLRGLPLRRAVTAAVAVGACNVEAADALSGIRTWEATMQRVAAGWERREVGGEKSTLAPGWKWDEIAGLWNGPAE